MFPLQGVAPLRVLSKSLRQKLVRVDVRKNKFPSSSTMSKNPNANSSLSSGLVLWKVDPLLETSSCNNSSTKPTTQRNVGIITLNSPTTYNALTVEMGHEFSTLCHRLAHDISTGHEAVDAVILTGQGSKAFSAGGNLDWLRSLRHNSVHGNADLMLRFYQSFLCIRHLPVPVVAALPGPAVGAGAGLALACDLRVAASTPHLLGLNFTRLGIHTGMGAAHLLQHANLPRAILHEILLTGRTLSSTKSLEYGLVNRTVEDGGDVVQGAKELVWEVVGATHPLAVRTLVQTLRAPVEAGFHAALQRDAAAQAMCYARNDWGEGVNAVAEKRNAVFEDYHAK